jgi:hypothetical protein
MFGKLFGGSEHPVGLHHPYREPSTNLLYNLLFCDDLSLFLQDTVPADSPLRLLQAANDLEAVANLATDASQESRIRALAYNLLRAKGWQVPSKVLLGVIFEIPQQGGLDTLAVYIDRRIRYINQTGKILIIESPVADIANKIREMLAASQQTVNQIGPWDKPRLPPPAAKNADIPMTFLVSDGLYFGQGAFRTLEREAMSAPLIQSAGQLFKMIVDFALGPK